jgi:hypothetical protein
MKRTLRFHDLEEREMSIVYAEPPVSPPRNGLTANGVSAVSSGVVVATQIPSLMFLALQMTAVRGTGTLGYLGGELHHLGLAAALMVVATFFAGLALALTALSRCAMPEGGQAAAATAMRNVSKTPLQLYVTLTLLGLAVDAGALGLLARHQFMEFRLAAAVGTVLEIAALVVGLRRHLGAARK